MVDACSCAMLARSNAYSATAAVCCTGPNALLTRVKSGNIAAVNCALTSSACSLRDGAAACARRQSTLLARVLTIEGLIPYGVCLGRGETERARISLGGPSDVRGTSGTLIAGPLTLPTDAASLISRSSALRDISAFSIASFKALKHAGQ